MFLEKITAYLDRHNVGYAVSRTSSLRSGESVRNALRTVVVEIDGRPGMVVVPASRPFSLEDLRFIVGTMRVRIADESECRVIFPGCDPDAIPPFGNFAGVEVYADPAVAGQEEIVFHPGDRSQWIRIAWRDFERLVEPRVIATR
ncbi:MAG: YbaK/EbsC family protein [Thermoanaerobaculia bacterium]